MHQNTRSRPVNALKSQVNTMQHNQFRKASNSKGRKQSNEKNSTLTSSSKVVRQLVLSSTQMADFLSKGHKKSTGSRNERGKTPESTLARIHKDLTQTQQIIQKLKASIASETGLPGSNPR